MKDEGRGSSFKSGVNLRVLTKICMMIEVSGCSVDEVEVRVSGTCM